MFAAYLKEGLDAVEILRRSVEVTKEFEYDATLPNVRERIKPRFVSTKLVPVKNRILSERAKMHATQTHGTYAVRDLRAAPRPRLLPLPLRTSAPRASILLGKGTTESSERLLVT